MEDSLFVTSQIFSLSIIILWSWVTGPTVKTWVFYASAIHSSNHFQFTLTSTDKPAVLTVMDPNSHYGCYLYTQSFSVCLSPHCFIVMDGFESSATQLDWLPGAASPPTVPNLSFNKDTAIIPPKIPGPLKTFVVYNGTVTFTLSSNYPESKDTSKNGKNGYGII